MDSLEALHAAHPFADSRMLKGAGSAKGIEWALGIRTWMQRMCLASLYCKLRTRARHPQHKVYAYLLWHKTVTTSC